MSGDPQQIKTRKKPIISVADEIGDSADLCEPSSKKASGSHNLRLVFIITYTTCNRGSRRPLQWILLSVCSNSSNSEYL